MRASYEREGEKKHLKKNSLKGLRRGDDYCS